jgi:hypothetical protein
MTSEEARAHARLRQAVAASVAVACGVTVAVVPGCGLALGGLGAAQGTDASGDDALALEETSVDDGRQHDEETPDSAEADATQDPAVMLAQAGSLATGTGLAQQTHILYATNSARWWLFWIAAGQPQQLQVSSSPDFVTWTVATPLALPAAHGGIGGNFSAAYADLGGVDVVHLTFSLHFAPSDSRHLHARATLSGGAILWGQPLQLTQIDSTLTDPDGPATMVMPDGHIWDSTGWAQYFGTGNEVAWESSGTDQGTSWDGMFGGQQGIATATDTVNARALFTVGTGATPFALWALGDQVPDPSNVGWSQDNTIWSVSPGTVFPTGNTQSSDDWDAVLVSATDLRVVRRTIDSNYDHVSYDGSSWTTMAAPPNDPGLIETGVVALSDGPRVAIVAIGSDPASSVRMTEWTGVSWSAWTTLDGFPAQRGALSGWSSSGGHAAVIWTEAPAGQDAGGDYAVKGMAVQL